MTATVDLEQDLTRRPSGLYVPRRTPRYSRPTGIDLFCGCGGFSLGFIQAGFHVIAACDNDPLSAETYLHNLGAYPVEMHFVSQDDEDRMEKALKAAQKRAGEFSKSGANRRNVIGDAPGCGHFWLGDIRNVTGAEILSAVGLEKGEVDCVFGGPPCQGFSTGGKRNVMDPRNSLVFEFARLVLEIQPKAMVMENVPGILSMVTPEGLPVVDSICRILEDGGFGQFDALRRSLLATSGAGAVLGGKPTKKGPHAADADGEDNEELQPTQKALPGFSV